VAMAIPTSEIGFRIVSGRRGESRT
jgi:hypothetical protein